MLRRTAEGAAVGWLIVTGMSEEHGWPAEQVRRRDAEIAAVTELVGFTEVFNLRLPAARLDTLPMADLVQHFARVFTAFQPTEVFVPHPADVHSDHRLVFEAAAACTKWFRYPSVRRVLAYETISETDFGLAANTRFQQNSFVDITAFLERKLDVMAVYQSELGTFPFPRSREALRALAVTHGAAAGFGAAEAFQLLRERQ